MYIYDHPFTAWHSRHNEVTDNVRPAPVLYYPPPTACVLESYGLGQGVPSSVSYTQPGQTLDPQSDYILAPEVMDAVGHLLSTQVPVAHLAALGSSADPLMIERGLIIYRYDDGRLRVGTVNFGTLGMRTSEVTTRYSANLEYHTFRDAGTGQVAYPWLYLHTHPAVQKYPEVPSGVSQENTRLSGDLYVLRNEPTRQIGIMTIGVNSVITNFRSAPDPIPFSLAIRDPIKGPTNYRKTAILESHKAADTALRLMFRRPTVCGYYTGDLRTGRAVPYLSAREQRKLTRKIKP